MSFGLDILFRWMHILSAIAMVGGTIFMRFALAPAAANLAEDTRAALHEAVRSRWAKLVMMGSGFLLISGLYNAAMMAMRFELSPLYNGLLFVKILLALVIFYLAAVLTGRSESAQRFQQNRMKWLTINLVLAITLVCMASVMKILPHVPKTREESRGLAPTTGDALANSPLPRHASE